MPYEWSLKTKISFTHGSHTGHRLGTGLASWARFRTQSDLLPPSSSSVCLEALVFPHGRISSLDSPLELVELFFSDIASDPKKHVE
ncbi:hypothetical protein JMJ77_0001917 [Colletotrichum scovillei]|uniref:Uncharacterized protein n=1 Tax=Colletotrichum scovillei TaxID=1209932 RepID=A0A9P7R8J9_9PEZI|nr:hypothetical protein JMJ77_0001917 [Colletotrichum scovillei]KAG7070328.1 hypothetical protein JMJ76_0001583 [Colletotrichum scovillei]KAG7078579.1 hypothetical protein JMJ78_0002249 [Colletotrichum scovillei]